MLSAQSDKCPCIGGDDVASTFHYGKRPVLRVSNPTVMHGVQQLLAVKGKFREDPGRKGKMKVIEIAFTGYPVTNLKRARQFYEGTLGLTASRTGGDETRGWIEYDIGPGTLSIGNVAPEWKPSPGGGCAALEVEDFASAMERLRVAGCPLYGPMESPVCRMAVVSDPDGNSIVIHKRKA